MKSTPSQRKTPDIAFKTHTEVFLSLFFIPLKCKMLCCTVPFENGLQQQATWQLANSS